MADIDPVYGENVVPTNAAEIAGDFVLNHYFIVRFRCQPVVQFLRVDFVIAIAVADGTIDGDVALGQLGIQLLSIQAEMHFVGSDRVDIEGETAADEGCGNE